MRPKKGPLGGSGEARNFERRGQIFHIFSKRIFFGRTHLKLIEKQGKAIGGSGSMLPRKIFENLPAVIAILTLFE